MKSDIEEISTIGKTIKDKKKVYKTFLDSGFTKEFLAKDLVNSHWSFLFFLSLANCH